MCNVHSTSLEHVSVQLFNYNMHRVYTKITVHSTYIMIYWYIVYIVRMHQECINAHNMRAHRNMCVQVFQSILHYSALVDFLIFLPDNAHARSHTKPQPYAHNHKICVRMWRVYTIDLHSKCIHTGLSLFMPISLNYYRVHKPLKIVHFQHVLCPGMQTNILT